MSSNWYLCNMLAHVINFSHSVDLWPIPAQWDRIYSIYIYRIMKATKVVGFIYYHLYMSILNWFIWFHRFYIDIFGKSTIQSRRCENSGSNPPAPGVWIEKMPPEPKAREAFFSIHTTGAGGFEPEFSHLLLWIVEFPILCHSYEHMLQFYFSIYY